MTSEIIKKEVLRLKGKKAKIFFRYNNISYNIKKSGTILDCDDKFFVIDEVQDGRTTYSYDFVISLEEDKK